MMVVFALALGLVAGGILSHRLFSLALTVSSRRAVEQLRATLDGLEAAHAMRRAMLEHETEIARRFPVPEAGQDQREGAE